MKKWLLVIAACISGCASGGVIPSSLNNIVQYPGYSQQFFRVMTRGVSSQDRQEVVGEWLGDKTKCEVQTLTITQVQSNWTVEEGEEKKAQIMNGYFTCQPKPAS